MKKIIVMILLFTTIGILLAQDVKDLRAIHMGGNWGSNVTGTLAHPPEYFEFLNNVNTNWIGISIALHIDNSMDSTVERKYTNVDIPTFTDDVLKNTITALQQYGFNVYLTLAFEIGEAEMAAHPVSRWQLGDPNMPNEDPNILPEFWPWGIEHPKHESFVKKFWETYTDQAIHFAEIAESLGVTLFSLGTETERLFRSRSGDYWPNDYGGYLRAMADTVKSVYNGKLTYDMSYDALTANDFYGPGSNHLWEDMGLDVIGISAYFELMETMPNEVISVDSLEKNWERIFTDYLIPLKNNNQNIPILFLEFGYVNSVEAPYMPGFNEFQPWVFKDDNENGLDDSQETQANIYEAFFNIKKQNPGIIEGAFLWGHDMCDDNEWASIWGTMHHFGVRQKLAEEVVRTYYNSLTGVNSIDNNIPDDFRLLQNFPNPFNPTTKIKYSIPRLVVGNGYHANARQVASSVRLIIYDILGREVTTLVNKQQQPGNYEIEFNASNLPSGIYFYRLQSGSFAQTKKLMLLR